MTFFRLLFALWFAELRLRWFRCRLDRLTLKVRVAVVGRTSDTELVRWAVAEADGRIRMPDYLDTPGWKNTALGDRWFGAMNECLRLQASLRATRARLANWVNDVRG